MMMCPYCDRDFLSTEECEIHILREHPEKTASAEAFAKAMATTQLVGRIHSTACWLASITIGNKGVSKEEALSLFRYFVEQLWLMEK